MSTTSRSHLRHLQHQNESKSDEYRKVGSRIPTKSAQLPSNKSEAAQHGSDSTEITSRSISRLRTPGYGTRRDTKEVAGAMKVRSDSEASRRLPTVQQPLATDNAHPSVVRDALQPPPMTPTPSLVSGSSISTFDSPNSVRGLRRKPSSVERYAAQRKPAVGLNGLAKATMSSRADNPNPSGHTDPSTAHGPNSESMPSDRDQVAEPALRHFVHPTSPAVPAYAQSATPSTRYTGSPFSHAATPSSASSCSPAVPAPTGIKIETRQTSPMRSRRPALGITTTQLSLPPVRESSTSSSNSTVKQPSSKARPEGKELAAQATAKGYAAATAASRTRQQTTPVSRAAAAPAQIPPELAHLNVDLRKPLPPRRPSRDNTPSITDLKKIEPPVVQSDLPRLYTTYHKRTPSLETPVSPSAPSPGFKARFGFSSRSSSRQESPRIDSAVSPSPSARSFAWSRSPDATKASTQERRRLQRKDSPAVAPAPSPNKSARFGIFSRKAKPDSAKATEKPKRQPTRGPAAGTGHEGYGRFGFRGRSSSTTSSNDLRSPSVASHASSAPSNGDTFRHGSISSVNHERGLDPFLRNLQAPKVLRGSGNTLSTAASTWETQEAYLPDPSSSSSIDSYPRPQLLPSAMQAEASSTAKKRPPLATRLPSDSSEDDAFAQYTPLSARRGLHHLPPSDSGASARTPTRLATSSSQSKYSVNGYGTEMPASHQTDGMLPGAQNGFEGREGVWLRPQHSRKGKAAPKWSFLQRAQASPRPKGKEKIVPASNASRHADRQAQDRHVSQFGMLDPVEPIDLHEIQQLVQESEMSQDESVAERQYAARIVPYDRRHSNLLPSPPRQSSGNNSDIKAGPIPPVTMVRRDESESPALLHAQTANPQRSPHIVDIPRSPPIDQLTASGLPPPCDTAGPQMQVQFEKQGREVNFSEQSSDSSSSRHPRLSPIGRIPCVVSKRDREYKLPDTSFSRPRTQNHTNVKPPGALYNQIRASRELSSPIDSGSQPVSSAGTRSERDSTGAQSSIRVNAASQSTNRTSINDYGDSEFVISLIDKNMNLCNPRRMRNGNWNTTMSTMQKPQQDDPWAEYDELMDDMLPQQTPLSAGSSLGAPFQYAEVSCQNSPSFPMPLNLTQPPSSQLPSPPRSRTTPAVLSVQQQVTRFMQPSLSPLVPRTATLSGILDHYGNESTLSLVSSKHSSIPQAARSGDSRCRGENGADTRASVSSRYSRASGHSRSSSLPEANVRNSRSSFTPSVRVRDTQLFGIAENYDDPRKAQDTLRFGALMTSKWLSFGQVLFSPAHNEMALSDDPRVLVIDGLGSDWSYYVALNYPNAEVYNLGVSPTPATMSWPGIDKAPPPKLRHIPLQNIATSFPFPKGFFTAVVLRFPIATTDQAYHACIFECKRVLRPGGFLEVAVLDLDLVNMGQRARSVIKGLKIRMQAQDPSVSLRNMSDFMVRLIGRRGFEDIKRGVVGVPVAGHVPKSQDISSVSSGQSDQQIRRPSLARINTQEITFADLLDDARNSQYISDGANDESITKMVAKVGRWWYSTCYETPLLSTNKSIWQDQGLLRECEKQGTSFRLFLCHAQKPQQTRRRTVSV